MSTACFAKLLVYANNTLGASTFGLPSPSCPAPGPSWVGVACMQGSDSTALSPSTDHIPVWDDAIRSSMRFSTGTGLFGLDSRQSRIV